MVKLMNVEALRIASATALTALSGSEYSSGEEANVIGLLDAARGALQGQASADEELAALEARINELMILTTDIASDLSSYAASLDVGGPERLAQVQTRRAQLATLMRKYGADIAELPKPRNSRYTAATPSPLCWRPTVPPYLARSAREHPVVSSLA